MTPEGGNLFATDFPVGTKLMYLWYGYEKFITVFVSYHPPARNVVFLNPVTGDWHPDLGSVVEYYVLFRPDVHVMPLKEKQWDI